MKKIAPPWRDNLIKENTGGGDHQVTISSYLWRYPLSSGEMFLFNLLTGCIDVLNAEETGIFLEIERSPERIPEGGEKLARRMMSRGHIWNDLESQEEAVKRLMQDLSNQAMQRSLMFFLCVNHACPVGCRHCFELDVPQTTKTLPMPLDMIQAAFDAIDMIRVDMGRDGRTINLFGGEPFLPQSLESIRYILKMAQKKGYRLTTFTSGIFLEPFLPVLKEYAAEFDWFSITLDVSEEQHNRKRRVKNAYQLAAANINRLLESGIPLIVRINLDRENIGHLDTMLQTFQQYGWVGRPNFRIQLSPVTDHHCVRTNQLILDEASIVLALEALLRQSPAADLLLDRGCYFSLDYLAVNLGYRQPNSLDYAAPGPRVHLCMSNNRSAYLFGADGLVYTCDEVVGMPKYAVKQYFPSIKKLTNTIWQDLMASEISKCRACPYIFLCGGGCLLASIAQHGRPDNPSCPDVNAFLQRYLASHEQDLMQRQG